MILVGSRTSDTRYENALRAEVEAFIATGWRVSAISQRQRPADTVVIENRALAQWLVALGYRRFAVLAGPRDCSTARDRLAGFRDGLRQAGGELAADHVVHGEFTRDGGDDAAASLAAQQRDVECVFAVNDIMAVGAMAALRDITPSLTTVRVPLDRLGEAALDLVLDEPADRAGAPFPRRVRGARQHPTTAHLARLQPAAPGWSACTPQDQTRTLSLPTLH